MALYKATASAPAWINTLETWSKDINITPTGHIIFIKLLLSCWNSSQIHPLSALLLVIWAEVDELLDHWVAIARHINIPIPGCIFFFSLYIDCKLFQFMYSRFATKPLHSFFHVFVSFFFFFNFPIILQKLYLEEVPGVYSRILFFFVSYYSSSFLIFLPVISVHSQETPLPPKLNKMLHKYLKYSCIEQ